MEKRGGREKVRVEKRGGRKCRVRQEGDKEEGEKTRRGRGVESEGE